MGKKELCKGKCHQTRFPYSPFNCNKMDWKDGYCKTHHPEEKMKRYKQRTAAKDELYRLSQLNKQTNMNKDLPQGDKKLHEAARNYARRICKSDDLLSNELLYTSSSLYMAVEMGFIEGTKLAASPSDKVQEKEIVELKRKVSLYKRLFELTKKFKDDAERKAFENYAAKVSIESEKDMNSILTDENQKLQKEIERLKGLIDVKVGEVIRAYLGGVYLEERVEEEVQKAQQQFKTENNL